MNHVETLKILRACEEGCQFARKYKSGEEAWQNCERGDWLLWYLEKTAKPVGSPALKKIVLIACECARLALPFVPAGEARPLRAIELGEQWARGGASLEYVKKAAAAAADAAADAAAYAAYAAAAAAAAAYAAADAAAYAAADAAAYAAAAADAAAERRRILNLCAEIVRKHYPQPPTGGSYEI